MKKALVALVVLLAVAIPIAASASTHHPSLLPKPHIVGVWPNDVSISGTGGYVVWNTGKVQAVGHAPYYGSVSKKVTNIVGFASDPDSGGYWLIAANGTVYAKGTTCQFQKLIGPRDPPKSKVVGAVNTTNGDEGFEMVTSADHLYSYTCQFVD